MRKARVGFCKTQGPGQGTSYLGPGEGLPVTEGVGSQVRWGHLCLYDCCSRGTPIHHTRTMVYVLQTVSIVKRNLFSHGAIIECGSCLSGCPMNVGAFWFWAPSSLRAPLRGQPTVTKTSINGAFRVVLTDVVTTLSRFLQHLPLQSLPTMSFCEQPKLAT